MERFLIKSKKQMLLVIGVFTLVMLVGTVTYAFFNYTRTGAANTIRVGRIAFNTNQTQTINLTNAFPITVTKDSNGHITNEAGFDTFEITITGDTDYSGGVEYLVSTTNTNITTSGGKQVPVSIDVIANNLGTENSNYFTARDSATSSMYKRLIGDTIVGDQMVLVGYIVPNNPVGTQAGINGTLTIKAYLDDSLIGISDTYDGTESDNMGTTNAWAEGKTIFTTTEWSNLHLSFKVKVEANEGIWVNGSLEEIMRKDAVMDNISSEHVSASTGIDFGAISSSTNGQGVYMRAGTENTAYPILYYRGDVSDNNVLFNNKCWKAVRTTDTGGVKLVYNGELSHNKRVLERSEYGELVTNTGNYTFDTTNNSWNATMTESVEFRYSIEMSFNLPVGNYNFEISGTTPLHQFSDVTLEVNVNNDLIDEFYGINGNPINGYGSINVSASTDIVSLKFYGEGCTSSKPSNVSIKFLKEEESLGCDNKRLDTYINISETNLFRFNMPTYSPANVGYMYGDVYTSNLEETTPDAYYGSGFTYDGTNYTLVDPVTTKNNTHHYTCNLTTADGTCATIRYYYYGDHYVNLTGGEGIERAMEKMQTNTNDSNAKTQIDSWYASNMNTVTNKLEDTIWCNDRSVGNGNNNGWIANGGDLNTYLYYGATQRSNYASNTSTVKNQPSLACTNKNDSFTVSNGAGNQKLQYPVALLTEDEMVLAGGLVGSSSTFYLNNGSSTHYWSLSPAYFDFEHAGGHYVVNGRIDSDNVYATRGLRPSVSLKPGTPVVRGDGTVTNPYVIS